MSLLHFSGLLAKNCELKPGSVNHNFSANWGKSLTVPRYAVLFSLSFESLINLKS